MSTPTTAYAELEIGLHRMETATYQVELRFTDPASEAEIPPARGTATFDPAELLALQQDPSAYGETLAERLFDDDNIRGLYLRAIRPDQKEPHPNHLLPQRCCNRQDHAHQLAFASNNW